MKNWTIRIHLTVLYSVFFLLAGIAVLGLTYVLVERTLDSRIQADTSTQELTPEEQTIAAVRKEQAAKIRADTMESLLSQGAVALAGVGVVAGFFGWVVAGRALRPVHRITATAQRIADAGADGRGLGERIGLDGPHDEIQELADTFDSMLERLDRSFDGQRRFVANASHELRTPLAVNRALAELAITKEGAAEETIRLGESLLRVNARHERLIDGLLTLADSESSLTERSEVDLAEIARFVLETTRTSLTIRSSLDTAMTSGDPVLLERMTQNLVENAIRHNSEDGWLSISTLNHDGHAVLEVANTGPVVPGYEVESLFQPFRRLHHERTGRDRGFGLGLSIVRAVTRAHDGEVRAIPREGGGLVVTVSLPGL